MLITTYLKIKTLGLLVLTVIYAFFSYQRVFFLSLELLEFLLIWGSKFDHELIFRNLVLPLKDP